ncbi:MAG: MBL fold metallo-hydrolase, partial [Burkholderiaceae bacterium]|nr:MBL fold metallo-hydrolase [Burkholderiaceae bacterium]
MSDTSLQRERLEKPTLIYPFETPPEVGQVLKIMPGVVWMRMPLPMVLNHINIWSLEDDNGWAVVDTGMRTDETLATWRAL